MKPVDKNAAALNVVAALAEDVQLFVKIKEELGPELVKLQDLRIRIHARLEWIGWYIERRT